MARSSKFALVAPVVANIAKLVGVSIVSCPFISNKSLLRWLQSSQVIVLWLYAFLASSYMVLLLQLLPR
jgi:hypothetical protein